MIDQAARSGFFHARRSGTTVMPSPVKAHNPTSVWTVPDTFRPIYSHACELAPGARALFISGQFGVAPDGGLPGEFLAQADQAMSNVEALLAAAGMTLENVVKLTYFLTRAADFPALAQLRRERWAASEPPAVTAVVVSALARPEYLIEIEATAAAP
jgi:enamine deaminase RidA (YjgF/YER057c/UK114 family)